MSTSMRRTRGAIAIVTLAVLIAACGGTASTGAPTQAASVAPSVAPATPAATTESAAPSSTAGGLATTGRIEVPDKGFALTLPEGWNRIDLTSGDLEAMMAAAGQANPELAAAYTAQIQAMLASGLVLFAFGPNPESGTNLNVLQLPGGGLSLDLLEQLNLGQIETMADGNVTTERVTLPAGDAIHFAYAIPAQGLPAPVSIDQYILLIGGNQFVVTVTGGSEGDAQAIAQSIEVLD